VLLPPVPPDEEPPVDAPPLLAPAELPPLDEPALDTLPPLLLPEVPGVVPAADVLPPLPPVPGEPLAVCVLPLEDVPAPAELEFGVDSLLQATAATVKAATTAAPILARRTVGDVNPQMTRAASRSSRMTEWL
jgi:hypothetical protein